MGLAPSRSRADRPSARRRGVGVLVASLGLTASLVGVATPASAESNSPPAPAPDLAEVVAGEAVTIHPLANDVDPDPGDALALVSVDVADPDVGTATVVGDAVLIEPSEDFVGTLEASYVVSDGSATAQGDISVLVEDPNEPPVAVDDTASMHAPGTIRIDPRVNDSDPDGDPLEVTGISGPAAGTGTAELDGQTVVISTPAGYQGPLEVSYTLSDGRGGSAMGRILVTVLGPVPNRRPVAVRDTAKVRAGDTYRIRVLPNDYDPDGHRIRLVKAWKITKTRKVEVDTVRAKVRVTVSPAYAGFMRIRYRISDPKGASDTAVLRLTVVPPSASRLNVERTLARLRLPVGTADGQFDAHTRRAVCAWRTITGRTAHRGLPTRAEKRALVSTVRLPKARRVMIDGPDGLTVSVTCQAAFWLRADRTYRRVMPVSTGMAGYRTRLGTWRVFRSYSTWRYSTIYPEARMYKPMQFSGGQALHGSATDALVKTYPASHGCVRMLHRDIDALQAAGFGLGSLVKVIGYW